ncbi:MAG: hypothetical protein M1401_07885 [Chloroflexi bacterium]|nr:hypothetical protein [Chloroflexota bacterium]
MDGPFAPRVGVGLEVGLVQEEDLGPNNPGLGQQRHIEGDEGGSLGYARLFGEGNFWLEVQNYLLPEDRWLIAETIDLADRLGLGVVATNDVHYATPTGRRLQDVLVCIKNRTILDAAGRLRRPNGEYYLESAAEMAELFARYPGAVANSVAIAERCSVDLGFANYRFPIFPVPEGDTPFIYLYKLCQTRAHAKYRPITPAVSNQLAHELDVIHKTNLTEYFLIVWDIVRFAKERGIPCQGRGAVDKEKDRG